MNHYHLSKMDERVVDSNDEDSHEHFPVQFVKTNGRAGMPRLPLFGNTCRYILKQTKANTSRVLCSLPRERLCVDSFITREYRRNRYHVKFPFGASFLSNNCLSLSSGNKHANKSHTASNKVFALLCKES